MRIALDRKRLLGFDSQTNLDVSVTSAKVGTKTTIVGVRSASHDRLVESTAASVRRELTFPVRKA